MDIRKVARLVCVFSAVCCQTGGRASCPVGFTPPDCQDQCKSGLFGVNCASVCPATCIGWACKPDTGFCYKCHGGFTGPKCSLKCRRGFFGQDCKIPCPLNCLNSVCDPFTGFCERCLKGYAGVKCERRSVLQNSNVQSVVIDDSDVDNMNRKTSRSIVVYILVVVLSCLLPVCAVALCVHCARKHSSSELEPGPKPMTSHIPVSTTPPRRPGRLTLKHELMQTIEEESSNQFTMEDVDHEGAALNPAAATVTSQHIHEGIYTPSQRQTCDTSQATMLDHTDSPYKYQQQNLLNDDDPSFDFSKTQKRIQGFGVGDVYTPQDVCITRQSNPTTNFDSDLVTNTTSTDLKLQDSAQAACLENEQCLHERRDSALSVSSETPRHVPYLARAGVHKQFHTETVGYESPTVAGYVGYAGYITPQITVATLRSECSSSFQECVPAQEYTHEPVTSEPWWQHRQADNTPGDMVSLDSPSAIGDTNQDKTAVEAGAVPHVRQNIPGYPDLTQPVCQQIHPDSTQPVCQQIHPDSTQPVCQQIHPDSTQPVCQQIHPDSTQPVYQQIHPDSTQPVYQQIHPDSTQPVCQQIHPDSTQPVCQQIHPDSTQPVYQQIHPDSTQPMCQQIHPDPTQPMCQQVHPDPTQPVCQQVHPDPTRLMCQQIHLDPTQPIYQQIHPDSTQPVCLQMPHSKSDDVDKVNTTPQLQKSQMANVAIETKTPYGHKEMYSSNECGVNLHSQSAASLSESQAPRILPLVILQCHNLNDVAQPQKTETCAVVPVCTGDRNRTPTEQYQNSREFNQGKYSHVDGAQVEQEDVLAGSSDTEHDCSPVSAAGLVNLVSDSRQITADSRQITADSRQITADSRQITADSRQITADVSPAVYIAASTAVLHRCHVRGEDEMLVGGDVVDTTCRHIHTVDYTHLTVRHAFDRSTEGCNVFQDSSSFDFAAEERNEQTRPVSDGYTEQTSGAVCKQNGQLISFNTDNVPSTRSFPVNGSANNINRLHVLTRQPSSSSTTTSSTPAHRVRQTSCLYVGRNEQMKQSVVTDTFISETSMPLFSICSSAPMKLSVTYCKNNLDEEKPCLYPAPRYFSMSSLGNVDECPGRSRDPLEVSVQLTSPPKDSQKKCFKGKDSGECRHNLPHQIFLESGRPDLSHQRKSSAIKCDQFGQVLYTKETACRHTTTPHCHLSVPTSSQVSTGKCAGKCARCETLSSVMHKKPENRSDASNSTCTFDPISRILDENPIRHSVVPEARNFESLTPVSAIRMSVRQALDREILTLHTSDRGAEILPKTRTGNQEDQRDRLGSVRKPRTGYLEKSSSRNRYALQCERCQDIRNSSWSGNSHFPLAQELTRDGNLRSRRSDEVSHTVDFPKLTPPQAGALPVDNTTNFGQIIASNISFSSASDTTDQSTRIHNRQGIEPSHAACKPQQTVTGYYPQLWEMGLRQYRSPPTTMDSMYPLVSDDSFVATWSTSDRSKGSSPTTNVQGLNTGSVQGLNRGSVQGLNTGGVQGLNTGGVQGLNTGSVQGLNTGSVQRLNTGGVQGLNTGSVQGLNTGSVQGLNTGSVQGLNTGGHQSAAEMLPTQVTFPGNKTIMEERHQSYTPGHNLPPTTYPLNTYPSTTYPPKTYAPNTYPPKTYAPNTYPQNTDPSNTNREQNSSRRDNLAHKTKSRFSLQQNLECPGQDPVGVYPLPSLLEELGIWERTVPTAVPNTESCLLPAEHRDVVVAQSTMGRARKKTIDVGSGQSGCDECSDVCSHHVELRCQFNNNDDNRLKLDSMICFSDYNKAGSDCSVMVERKRAPHIFFDNFGNYHRLSNCCQSKTGPELSLEKSSSCGKDSSEFISVSEEASDVFFDALDTFPAGSQARLRSNHQDHTKIPARDGKRAVKFMETSARGMSDVDFSGNKSTERNYTRDWKNSKKMKVCDERINHSLTREKRRQQNIAFRFADPRPTDSTIDTFQHSVSKIPDRKRRPKHLHPAEGKDVAGNTNSDPQGKIVSPKISLCGQTELKARAFMKKRHSGSNNARPPVNVEGADSIHYRSVPSDKDCCSGKDQLSAAEDFYSIQEN